MEPLLKILSCLIVLCLVVVCAVRFQPRSVSIFINDSPLRNIAISQLAEDVAETDDEGRVFAPSDCNDGSYFIPAPNNKLLMFTFPPYGHKEIRFNGAVSTSIWTKYDFGFYRSTEESFQRDFPIGGVEEMLNGRSLHDLTTEKIKNHGR